MTESDDRSPQTDLAGVFLYEEVQALLDEGREQGYLKEPQIIAALGDLELSVEQIEEIHASLRRSRYRYPR